MDTKNSSTDSFFSNLDASFVNFGNEAENPPLQFKSTDCYVQKSFELPIPMLAGSKVKYFFTTSGGDISFSTKFQSSSGSEVIFSESRVPSDIEPYTGQFKSPKEGTLVLNFDNSYSWFTAKLLSYSIELFQPAFTVADNNRCLKSKSMLVATVEDTRRAELRLAVSKERMDVLNSEIPSLESKLSILVADLNSKKLNLDKAYSEAEEMSARIEANLEKKMVYVYVF